MAREDDAELRGGQVALKVHVAPHPDALVALLVDQLADPPEDPFAPELIAVPTRGIERWLTQQIAAGLAARGVGDGIAANIDFPSPWRLVREVLLAVPQVAASVDAWQGPDLIAHVLGAVDVHSSEPWMRLIERYLTTADGTPGPNRITAATKIAGLFSAYARRRPEMIRSWVAGDSTGPDGDPVPGGDAWQPRLWRLVRDQIGIPALAELLPAGLDSIRTGAVSLDLPDRLSIYGLTATDPLDLQVLSALGDQREVDLYVLHPSPALWEAVAGDVPPVPSARDTDSTSDFAHHPLLTSWGRDARELQLVLAAAGLTGSALNFPETDPATLLTQLQHDIRTNRPLSPPAPSLATSVEGGSGRRRETEGAQQMELLPLAADAETTAAGSAPPNAEAAPPAPALAAQVIAGTDRSIQIHVTHGARRQVEVTRDAILHVLAADQTLEPRDIVIMTPDLATFAPLLEAAFPVNQDDDGGLPDLRLRIADRSPAAVNPLVRFAATVLDLAASRLEAGRLRELVTRPVVQQRFGFDLDTAASIVSLIDDAEISWGLDAADREGWRAGSNDERTWRRGLDRALAGVFYEDDPVLVVAGTAPLDGVEGQEATPVGLLAAIVDRIVAIREMLATPLPASQWGRAIAAGVRLLAKPGWDDEWQLGQLERLLAETFPDPVDGAPDPVLSLAEAGRAVAGWTESRPSPLHFRTGDVTVCTLVPMRSVPYRVVCLLGMDDDRFPRSSRTDGDDLLLGDEILGDYDRATQDRQLLLDAVMAAGDHLIITYSGRDELTNGDLPPAVPIAELRDTVEAMVGADGLEAVETIHPLQSFSRANFTPGELDLPGPFGFDPVALAGARAVARRRDAAAGQEPPWPEWEPVEVVSLEDLIRFLQHPVQRFMTARMGFSVPKAGEIPDDTLPADLGALSRWGLKERLLDGLADGYDLEDLAVRELAGDGLPPGALGHDDLDDAVEAATELWNGAVERGYQREAMRPYRGEVQVGGVTVEGTVLADPDRAHLARVTASRVKGKHRLRAFAELVFMSALEPEVAWESFVLGRYAGGRGHVAVTIGPIGESPQERRAEAEAMLAELVALFVEGHRAPLPMPCESSYSWQRYVGSDRGKAWGTTRDAWENDKFSPEAKDPAHQLLLADLGEMRALLRSGFADYAKRLWAPIIPLSREKKL